MESIEETLARSDIRWNPQDSSILSVMIPVCQNYRLRISKANEGWRMRAKWPRLVSKRAHSPSSQCLYPLGIFLVPAHAVWQRQGKPGVQVSRQCGHHHIGQANGKGTQLDNTNRCFVRSGKWVRSRSCLFPVRPFGCGDKATQMTRQLLYRNEKRRNAARRR